MAYAGKAMSSAATLAEIRYRRQREDPAAENEVASYYLREKYTGSENSSNYDEWQSALENLNCEVVDFKDAHHEGSWSLIEVSDFDATEAHLNVLMDRAVSNHYKAVEDAEIDLRIHANCYSLFQRDYKCELLENPGGALSWNYPVKMIIPMRGKEFTYFDPRIAVLGQDDFKDYCDMSKHAAIARCRNRFPVPVILCEGKYICRSGTLAVRKGVAFGIMTKPIERQSREVPESNFSYFWTELKNLAQKSKRSLQHFRDAIKVLLSISMDDIKDLDVNVLNCLGISYICDLMVENRKIHTGLSVGSSEKVNLRKYGVFKSLRIPYPGCEFFGQYSAAGRRGGKLVFDWNAPEVNSTLGMSREEILPFKDVDWKNYMNWDIVELTRNYMRLLCYFATERISGGLLVHCISGWDRTPLFISLLRISLWADGLIHKSLSVLDMAYLTLGYDWYLFGHDLPTRLRKREEIMHFCFNFLPELASEKYSRRIYIGPASKETYLADRKRELDELSALVLKIYERHVKKA